MLAACLTLACTPPAEPQGALSAEQALAECQATVDGASGINARSISPQDAASGYTISGFVLTSCMEKHHYRCTQAAPNVPCAWVPMSAASR